jgi:thiol-disulfide isomerase/thioredoxin
VSRSRVLAAIGAVVLAVAIGAVFVVGNDNGAGSDAATPAGTDPATAGVAAPDLPDRGLHPPLTDVDGWLQSDVTSLEQLRGKVVAVQFWTFGCSNCKATLPHQQELHRKYADRGFEIVGVHAPEFDYEADVGNITTAAADLGVTWPIVLDTERHNFHSWQEGPNAFWPRLYLLDKNGHIRYDHVGEGAYAQIDAAVQALLAEPASSDPTPSSIPSG